MDQNTRSQIAKALLSAADKLEDKARVDSDGRRVDAEKCHWGGRHVEDAFPREWEFGEDKADYFSKLRGSEPFVFTCFCGKKLKSVLRGNNWRIPAHRMQKAPVSGSAIEAATKLVRDLVDGDVIKNKSGDTARVIKSDAWPGGKVRLTVTYLDGAWEGKRIASLYKPDAEVEVVGDEFKDPVSGSASDPSVLKQLRVLAQTVATMPHPRATEEKSEIDRARMNEPADITVSRSATKDDEGSSFYTYKVTFSTLRADQLAALKTGIENLGLEVFDKDQTDSRWDWKDILHIAPKGRAFVTREARRFNPLSK